MSDLPIIMNCIEITEPGGPEVLQLAQQALMEPKAGQVLVKVAAAGVNRPDIVQRMGLYPPPPGASDLPGLEIAGTVVAAGDASLESHIGREICALTSGGGYAEYCLVDMPLALPIPEGLTLTEAAALPETFFTVWTNVFDRGQLQAGETFLVHGGSSGIGTTAIMLAERMGAKVFTTAGSDEKCQACLDLGAARAINYKSEDFVEVIKEETDGKGVDLVLDMVGDDYVEKNLTVLALDGRLVNIAFLNGPKPAANLLPIMVKRLTFTGSTLRPQSLEAKANIASALKEKVWPFLSSGAIKPIIDSTFPHNKASEAHQRMESSQHIGKIVLTFE